MKCRKMKKWTDSDGKEHNDLVWFGSYGVDSDGKALRENDDYSTAFVQHTSYASERESVKNSLTQRMSVLKGELWYNVSYGIPLLDKIRKKEVIDAFMMNVLNDHADVREVTYFSSDVSGHDYSCTFIVSTSFGNVEGSV